MSLLKTVENRIRAAVMSRRFKGMGVEDRFTEIYRKGYWFGNYGNTESVSGSGSTMENTRLIREALPRFLQKHGITSILDAPCGDFHWMRHVTLPNGVHYIGGDIVAPLIKENRQKYPGFEFMHIDIIKGDLPDVQLLMCRDCLFHFSYEDIFTALRNYVSSGIPYILTTTMPKAENKDIVTGRHRPLNLNEAPFNLPEPMGSFADSEPPRLSKSMALWTREQVSNALNGR